VAENADILFGFISRTPGETADESVRLHYANTVGVEEKAKIITEFAAAFHGSRKLNGRATNREVILSKPE
jgi:hypothetical protein